MVRILLRSEKKQLKRTKDAALSYMRHPWSVAPSGRYVSVGPKKHFSNVFLHCIEPETIDPGEFWFYVATEKWDKIIFPSMIPKPFFSTFVVQFFGGPKMRKMFYPQVPF